MADARHTVAGDVLEEKPRAAAGDVLEEKPHAAVGDVLEEKPRAATAAEAVHDIGGAATDLEKDVIDLGLEVINSVIEPGEVLPDVIGIDLVLVGELRDHHVVGVESAFHHPLALEDCCSIASSLASTLPYDSDDDVDKGNIESFIAKEVDKIKAKGSSMYKKGKKYVCPYCAMKRKPKDGPYEHLLSHARDASLHFDNYKVRG
ncbi:putative LRR receptor-like serine/threonine-protein kinase [Hordeum vulgare]|nr:putative LRR receptor-like serine/threonine-protein kinase [Hordeum vulgare]